MTTIDTTVADLLSNEEICRDEIIAILRASGVGSRLEAAGIRWAYVQSEPISVDLGTVARVADHIEARADDATRIELAALSSAVLPESVVWVAAESGDLFAVELIYPGVPRVRDLHVFERMQVDGRLALVHAQQALARNATDEAATRLAYARQHIHDGDPTKAAIAFEEARVASRRRDVDACVAALFDAVAHDTRYRDHARRDREFAWLENEPRFIEFLAVSPQ